MSFRRFQRTHRNYGEVYRPKTSRRISLIASIPRSGKIPVLIPKFWWSYSEPMSTSYTTRERFLRNISSDRHPEVTESTISTTPTIRPRLCACISFSCLACLVCSETNSRGIFHAHSYYPPLCLIDGWIPPLSTKEQQERSEKALMKWRRSAGSDDRNKSRQIKGVTRMAAWT